MRSSTWRAVTAAVLLVPGLILASPGAATPPSARRPGSGVTIGIDLAHHNFGAAGEFAPLAKWLEAEGYGVRALREPFARETLAGLTIVVIKNALAERNALSPKATPAEVDQAWRLPTPSAFTPAEIGLLHEWVLGGGGLLLVFDHMPMPGAAQELAAAFGVEVSNGLAVDMQALVPFHPRNVQRAARTVFRRTDGTLADDPLTDGRATSERVERIASSGGSAFRLPAQGRSLLELRASFVSLLPEVAWQFSEATPRKTVAGWSQGGVLRVGRGRLAVFGDGSILMSPTMAASVGGGSGAGMDLTTADFAQIPRLLLNVLRWLSGGLEAS